MNLGLLAAQMILYEEQMIQVNRDRWRFDASRVRKKSVEFVYIATRWAVTSCVLLFK